MAGTRNEISIQPEMVTDISRQQTHLSYMHSPTRRLGLPCLGKNKDQQDTQGIAVDVPSLQAGNEKGAKNTINRGKELYQT